MGTTSLIPQSPGEVAKAILYIALTALAIFRTASVDGLVASEWIALVIAVVGLIPVYLVAGTLAKTIAAFVLAGGQALVLALGPILGLADISADAWIGVAFASFAAIGIAIVPNSPSLDYVPKHAYVDYLQGDDEGLRN